jgi:FkbM family methyltransferase
MQTHLVDRVAATRLERPLRRLQEVVQGSRMTRTERRNREYDQLTVKIIREVMSAASNSVDAGAHRGYFLKHLVRAAPHGVHYAFEPIPELAEALQHRIPRATVHAAALGEDDGSATFHYLPQKAAQSSLYDRPDRERGQQVVDLEVPVHRLDTVWPTDLPLAFLKIDVEKAEVPLLRGALHTLSQWRPVVAFECHPETLPEATELLLAAGLHPYLVEDFLDGRARPIPELHELAVAKGEWFFAARATE